MPVITSLQPTKRFERDAKGLDPQQRAALRDCLGDLQKDPIPNSRRVHLLNPKRDGIYSADLFTNTTSHKVTFSVDNGVATLRRVGTHKQIDDRP